MKHLLTIVTLLLVLTCCTSEADRIRMRAGLNDIDQRNRSGQPFTASEVQPYVQFFDEHGTPNDRLLAHYLLGRAYYEHGEAPMALQCYHDAIECVDTTDEENCDFAQLSRVYGQMAFVFYAQGLYREQLEYTKNSVKYAWLGKDTLTAMVNYEQESFAYEKLGLYDSAVFVSEDVANLFIKYGYPADASISLGALTQTLIKKGDYEKANNYLKLYENESQLIDEDGNIQSGKEVYYNIKGQLCLIRNCLDSAEYWYRKELNTTSDFNNQDGGAYGLAVLYERLQKPDSAAKYFKYAYAMSDSMFDRQSPEIIERLQSMYDYTRHQEIARKEKEHADKERRKVQLLIIVFVITAFVALLIMYKVYIDKLESKRLYMKKLEQLEQTQSEVLQLREHAEEYNKLIQEKEQEIDVQKHKLDDNLQMIAWEQAELQKHQILVEQLRTHAREFENLIVEKEREIKGLQSQVEERQKNILQDRASINEKIKASEIWRKLSAKPYNAELSIAELRECRKLIIDLLPEMNNLLLAKQYKLTRMDINVCILFRLGFKSKEVCNMLNISKGRVSQICSKILKNVFETEQGGAACLIEKLYNLS